MKKIFKTFSLCLTLVIMLTVFSACGEPSNIVAEINNPKKNIFKIVITDGINTAEITDAELIVEIYNKSNKPVTAEDKSIFEGRNLETTHTITLHYYKTIFKIKRTYSYKVATREENGELTYYLYKPSNSITKTYIYRAEKSTYDYFQDLLAQFKITEE